MHIEIHGALRRLWQRLLLIATVLTVLLAGCGQPETASSLELIPDIPENSTFGPLYTRMNSLLVRERPDVESAIHLVREWATQNLEGFNNGICAQTNVVYDAEFTRMYGDYTLGVTFPWMQILVRDGHRSGEPYLWKDASLLASTVLHEYVHTMQRARQVRELINSGASCGEARLALLQRMGIWNMGFSELRTRVHLSDTAYSAAERTLIYRWTSPIERARDEVEAAVLTVRWMRDHPGELNLMTKGGGTNWGYGMRYLNRLRNLATSDCFSPDRGAFEVERRIFEVEIPRYVQELSQNETEMRYLLRQQHIGNINFSLRNVPIPLNPIGFQGVHCNMSTPLELPPPAMDLSHEDGAHAGVHF